MSRAGWYRDPGDPTRFRHWDGRAWTTRHRSWPAWDLHAVDIEAEAPDGGPALEGPVRAAPLPAAAARGAAGEDAAVAWLRRPSAAPARPRARSRRPWEPASTASTWKPSRAPLVVFCLLVATAMAIMAVSVGLAGPRTATVDAVATDVSFVRTAGGVCQQGLGPLRHAQAMAAAPADPAQQAATSSAAAVAVSSTGDRLRQVPVRPDAAAAVEGWLAGWGAYAADQRALRSALLAAAPGTPAPGTPAAGTPGPGTGTGTVAGTSQSPAGGAAPGSPSLAALAGRVAQDVIASDQFALANGLAACRLGTDPSAGVVDIP